jgi:cyanophycinase
VKKSPFLRARLLILAAVAIAAALAAPSHGPAKGYLIITGGAPDYKNFLALAGGPKAHIVVIPTASITSPADQANMPPYCKAGPFAGMQCSVLHTTDRAVADSEAFVAPLRDATGVWLEGGRQWRLADAYLGTRTLKELFNVLDRGGVIGGGSAGATIQGSYMVRGSSQPDDNTIMMAPGHETGFGFFTNVAIDQHVDARGREKDLAVVMKAHPELLGIGLDQSTSITVHGDVLTVNGPQHVSIWDGKDHEGKGYYQLRQGDTLNTGTRVATVVEHPPEPVRKEITLDPKTLTRYVGMYQMLGAGAPVMRVTLVNNQLFTRLGNQGAIAIFAESPAMFFPKAVEAEIEFAKDDDQGRPAELILHQNGADLRATRLDEAAAKRITDAEAACAKRLKDQIPAEGSEAAVRKMITDLQAGKPDDSMLSPGAPIHQQLERLQAEVSGFGAIQSIAFQGVGPGGADIYTVKAEKGTWEYRIWLSAGGKVTQANTRVH